MNKKDAINIVQIIKENYPDAKCSLDFDTPFEMLVAVCLSAQCTDERVNKVTKTLFAKYNTPESFANADIHDIENLVHSCGFYKNKAKNLKAAGKKIMDDFNGEVPMTMDELITIPGVGRKSANVIMLEAFDNPQGIAVDTHVGRISKRIGFSNESDPQKIEKDLCKIIPKAYWKDVNHTFIWHGRNICSSQKPKCDTCPLKVYCKFYLTSV
jgi:endonuclease-3